MGRKSLQVLYGEAVSKYESQPEIKPLDRLSENDLYVLLLHCPSKDNNVPHYVEEVSRDFAERHGFKNKLHYDISRVWVKLDDLSECRGIREKLILLGYPHIELFKGRMYGEDKDHFTLIGDRKNIFDDKDGRALKIIGLFKNLGFDPSYAYVFSGAAFLDFEINTQNVAAITAFVQECKKRGDLSPVISWTRKGVLNLFRVFPCDSSDDEGISGWKDRLSIDNLVEALDEGLLKE